VFNGPALERQVAMLSKKIGLPVVKYSLVPTANPTHFGPQLENLPVIEGLELLHARKRYELRFYFQENDWDTGLGADLRSGYIDGLEAGLNYQGVGLFNDRWRVAASAGVGLRFTINEHQLYPAFSRAFGEFRWYARKFLGFIRPGIWITSNLFARQRKDLGVENYEEASAIGSVHVAFDLAEGAKLTPTVGVQWRRVFWITPTERADPLLIPPDSQRVRTFIELRAEWVIDQNNEWYRQHRLEAGARYYLGLSLSSDAEGLQPYGWVFYRYQKFFTFGWHDLLVKSRMRLAFGDVQFHDDENLGEYLHGAFGDTFVHKVGNVSAEFRFSLSRDVFKVSLFAEAAAWGQVNRIDMPNTESFRFGAAAGPGLHFLIQGMFQMDMYATFGWYMNRGFGFAIMALLNKVF
jgi:hypothetical protein